MPAVQDLIKHALPQDIWFHVSQLSSAHVYLRLPPGVEWDTGIPADTLEDCAQVCVQTSLCKPVQISHSSWGHSQPAPQRLGPHTMKAVGDWGVAPGWREQWRQDRSASHCPALVVGGSSKIPSRTAHITLLAPAVFPPPAGRALPGSWSRQTPSRGTS